MSDAITTRRSCANLLVPLGIWPQGPHGLAGSPDFLVVDLLQLLFQVFPVCAASVEFKRLASLSAVFYGLVQLLKYRLVGCLENWGPVESTAACCG